MYGLVGITALVLVGCSSTEDSSSAEVDADPIVEESAESIRLFGAIAFEGDDAVLMGEEEENCMIADPTTTIVVNNLESADVEIADDSGGIVAETSFKTFHDEERCSWLIDVEVEAESEYFVAHFNDMSTPKAYADDYYEGFLELDVTTPVMEEIKSR